MNRKVVWLAPDKYKGDYQFYKQWITDAWLHNAGIVKSGLNVPFKFKQIVGKFNNLASVVPDWLKGNIALVVCCGAHPNYAAWPYMYTHELIPIIWDCWPKYQKVLLDSIKQNHIKTVFCTSSQTQELIKKTYPEINAYWLPEGININAYRFGTILKKRGVDVLELGRQLPTLHDSLIKCNVDNKIKHLFSDGNTLLFKDFEELTLGLANSKITICYPRCDTHPHIAGDIETMTQRYWECMLSGTLMVGRAPQELITFCGYNPVINLKHNSADEIFDILNNIEDFQSLCDKNREYALKNSSWDLRVRYIKDVLTDLGYLI